MRIKDVVVGRVYAVKVNGRVCPVRLESVREGYKTAGRYVLGRGTYAGISIPTSYEGTNLRTGRSVRIRSAAKLRCELEQLNQTWVPVTLKGETR